MISNKYDLIILDCDGTLVDSEYLANKVTADVLNDFGLTEYTPEKCLKDFAGKSWNNVLIHLEQKHNQTIPKSIVDDYTNRLDRELKTADLSIKFAMDFVQYCHDNFKICVASNGEESNVVQELELQNYMIYFDKKNIFTKMQVEHGKPAPDLFVYAAEKMAVEPKRCLVIEDSSTGAQAGVAAGMDVWGFTGVAHNEEQARQQLRQVGAKEVFDNYHEMQNFLSGTV